MIIHSRARSTPLSRAEMVHRVVNGWRVADAVKNAGISRRTGYKWLARYRQLGEGGLMDRRSVPRRQPRKTSDERTSVIAHSLRMPRSTVARVLTRAGVGRLATFKASVIRYERQRPGELIHLDTKKLARISRIGHRITGDRRDTVDGAGWNTSTWPSTMLLERRTSRSWPTRRESPASAFCGAPSPTSGAWDSPASSSSPTTGPAAPRMGLRPAVPEIP